ncbi:MAG TPA: rRNA maturation RNase YbeY [Actinomycetes bacterium]|nr:rRNA maturation RNase YbeY [Actinomycetes bacterium]
MSVFLANEQSDVSVDEENLVGLARAALQAEGVAESELAILLVDRRAMSALNARFMGKNGPTDVLAFPIDGPAPPAGPGGGPAAPPGHSALADDDPEDELDEDESDDEPWLLGDVVLCPAQAAEQAARAGQPLADELELLTVHGILHLCGLDHAEAEEERVMKARTDELLAGWRAAARGRPPGGGRGV